MRLALGLIVLLLAPAAAGAQPRPLGVVEQTLARFDRDTLAPVGRTVELVEPHTSPVMAPGGRRFAIGVSHPGLPDVPVTGPGRVGLWLVDAATLGVERQIRTGIAAEAVVYPGKVAAVLQNGDLVVVDPESGKISRRRVGFSFGAPEGVHAGGHGVMVDEIRRGRGAEVVVIARNGSVRTAFVRLPGVGRRVALASDGKRAYIVGKRRIAVLDPATLRVTTRRFDGAGTSAAVAGGSLAISGPAGLRVFDLKTWRLLARERRGSAVYASGSRFIVAGGGRIAARDASGRVLWRTTADLAGVAAGRVYAQPAVLDAATGERVGTHPQTHSWLRLI